MTQSQFIEATSKLSPRQAEWVKKKAVEIRSTDWHVMDWYDIPTDEELAKREQDA